MARVNTYNVPVENLAVLSEALDKLRKRAKRHGLAEPAITLGEPFDEERRRYIFLGGTQWNSRKEQVRVVPVTVESEIVLLKGWTPVATLTHEPAGNLVFEWPGETMPESYRSADSVCDHCKKARIRNQTYVMRHIETGEWKQVGSTCVRDFIGVDPQELSQKQEHLRIIDESIGEASMWGGKGDAPNCLYHWIAITLAVIRTDGWMGSSKARDLQTSATYETVLNVFLNGWAKANEFRSGKFILEPREEDAAEAERIIEMAQQIPDSDTETYEHNLRTIARSEIVSGFRQYALAASMVAWAHRRDRMEAERARVKSEYVAEEGVRIETEVKLVSTYTVEGVYGPKTLHRMEDRERRVLVWWATGGEPKFGNGEWTRIRGRVQRLGEYKGVKQTQLTRCSIVQESRNPKLGFAPETLVLRR